MEPIGARILVVDDEVAIRDMLQIGLSKAGFTVKTVADGRTALEALRGWSPEAVVLDVMLPEIDGYSLLPAIRRVSEVPIIMLSAKTAVAEKVQGLLRGADDYLAKPFDIEELVARLLSALRRPRLEIRQTLRYGDLSIDVARRVVVRSGRRVQLSRREFDLLMTLVQQPERVFTRSQLLDYVWGVDRDVVPNVVETYISYLRAKIDGGEPVKLIRTMRGSGYTLSSRD
jgi:DNA-binding response OmpR family regulator